MDAVFNNAFFEWAGTLTSPAVPLADRREVERDLLRACAARPEAATVVMAGMLSDLAMTLPHTDMWRQLADRAEVGNNADDLSTYDALYDPVPGRPKLPWEWTPLPLDGCLLLANSFSGPEVTRQALRGLAMWNPVDEATAREDRENIPSEPGAGDSAAYSYGSRAFLMLLHRRSVYDPAGTASMVLDSVHFWVRLVGEAGDLSGIKLPMRPEVVRLVLP